MPLRELLAAFAFLTRLPFVNTDDSEPTPLADAKPYFPAVGLVIGGMLAVSQVAGTIGPSFGALATLIVWVWITGALHLDGLGDTADALGATHGDPERFHQVLKDPHAGNFAVTAIALQIVAKLVLLAELSTTGFTFALVLVPAWARWGILIWSALLEPLRLGLAASVRGTPSWIPILIWAAVLGTLSIIIAWPLLVAPIVAGLLAMYWRWRIGGITGDCLGASIEVMETALLATLLLAQAIT